MPSYSPVYSAQFILYTQSTPNASFDVPTGWTAVIRQWSVAQSVGSYLFYLLGQNNSEAPAYQLVVAASTDVVNYAAGECRFVVPGGGIISVDVSVLGDGVSIYVGGYLLRDTLT